MRFCQPPKFSREKMDGYHHAPPWRNRRRFFLPVMLVFLLLNLLFMGGMGLMFQLMRTRPMEDLIHRGLPLLCGVPLVVLVVGFALGGLTFRRLGRPMEEIFSAIDAVADGDLSVRVSENTPKEFGPLAERFNHMIAELEQAETRRRNMTADIAHELRNPLHIIQGNLEGMLDGVYEPSEEMLNNTLEETRLLARLVSDLQTLSLAEAGQLLLHLVRFTLAELVNDLVAGFAAQAAAQGIEIAPVNENPAREITADSDRLKQVLVNLVTNALRHTPAGGKITLETGTVPDGETLAGGVRIRVRDTGTGISAEDLPFIFDRFWRGDRSRTERANSGLGLAIAKQLVKAHGGLITVESQLGQGSVFVIDLPGN
ncbi:MAG TPA: HAMP domain-containing sensor histidine kinase [Anaerolineaceae bacterium]|nr:HAMP domain-containing sensor histidine kinase [Anaerolineaceae bacterium]HPN52016.1 HAMP domain-containing sensor histidine kinase [Anaerolineaceae bacterium]